MIKEVMIDQKRLALTVAIGVALFCISLTPALVYAQNEAEDETSASVIVASIFTLEVSPTYIDFGSITPGEWCETGTGSYDNEATCVSNNGRTWYLKVSAQGPMLGAQDEIPLDSLKWSIYNTTGAGSVVGGWNSFSTSQTLSYTSAGDDDIGNEVDVRFKYALQAPSDTKSGAYDTTIKYTMTQSITE
ncbi:MAG: hypothetical protein HQ593_01765 [Candidatus Omnitrophica bacterium]|nr:hypothetical protein [Candidatus Omnitrophota bacterium]